MNKRYYNNFMFNVIDYIKVKMRAHKFVCVKFKSFF